MKRYPHLESLEERCLLSHVLPKNSLTAESTAVVDTANPVIFWNTVALRAIQVNKTAPPVAARDLAIVQIAVDDAVSSITKFHRPDHVRVVAPRGASTDAAVAGAAHRTLSVLFPAQTAVFDTALAESLKAIPDGPSENAGVATGRAVAESVLAWRQGDGSSATVSYTPGTDPGKWRPTPAGFAKALLPQWPEVTTFALKSGTQFRPHGLPAITSRTYAAALNEVERLGSKNSADRTPEQTQIAQFWADGAGTVTPPGHWNEIATDIATRRHFGTARTAHMLAVLDAALADAGIAAWDAKYADNCWRPITAIREADTDGNPATTADPTWTPLLATPPFPSYVSGHSTFSAAASTVLSAFFGPNTHFQASSDALPGVTRSFGSFREAAAEAGVSRIYGGIHFSFDNRDGLTLGQSVGRVALRRFR